MVVTDLREDRGPIQRDASKRVTIGGDDLRQPLDFRLRVVAVEREAV